MDLYVQRIRGILIDDSLPVLPLPLGLIRARRLSLSSLLVCATSFFIQALIDRCDNYLANVTATGDWADAVRRAQKFVAQLTLEEKVNLTTGADFGVCVG